MASHPPPSPHELDLGSFLALPPDSSFASEADADYHRAVDDLLLLISSYEHVDNDETIHTPSTNHKALTRTKAPPLPCELDREAFLPPSPVSSSASDANADHRRAVEDHLHHLSSSHSDEDDNDELQDPLLNMDDACTILTSTVRSVQLFRVDGLTALCSQPGLAKQCIKSKCEIGGYEWEIICNVPTYSTSWLDFGLMLLSEVPPNGSVTASISCLLVHPRVPGNPSHPLLRRAPHSEVTASHVFKRHKDCSHQVMIVQKKSLPAPACPNDDYLCVECTITVLKEGPDASVATALPVPASNLQQHLGELLQSKTGSDITFVVSGESFIAHKSILAARSPVLMAEFFGSMRERSAQQVVIEDVEAEAFKAMLHFIYTDKVPEFDSEPEAAVTIAQHLLAAADRYGLDKLKVMCEDKLSGGVTVETAATTLALAEQHNCSDLKARCIEFILSSPTILEAVMATEGYKNLEAICPAITSMALCVGEATES
ncbi:BTB/POZ and MATH domain-containing protein 1-like [Hordeum vulgare subsp. vulgare]|uniref:BTB domain-containing protein n=1 Tax=Hordeum vulgare subsp. vulgare TaxID=112509 RepID=A0A8I6YKY9_HORVV|nr:BTB/POZ and MATH domain-containing protein 1-like [Hordeum vulgare subsp. vulgare]